MSSCKFSPSKALNKANKHIYCRHQKKAKQLKIVMKKVKLMQMFFPGIFPFSFSYIFLIKFPPDRGEFKSFLFIGWKNHKSLHIFVFFSFFCLFYPFCHSHIPPIFFAAAGVRKDAYSQNWYSIKAFNCDSLEYCCAPNNERSFILAKTGSIHM